MHEVDDKQWDEQLKQLGGHLYQSSLWKKFQQAQGRHTLQDFGHGWSWLGAVRTSAAKLNYLYLSYGPTLKDEAAFKASLESVKQAAEQAKVAFVRMDPILDMPETSLKQAGLTEVKEMQPRYRMILDLTPERDELWRNVSSSHRNYVNTAPKRGLRLEISNNPADLPKFLAQQAITAKRQGITMHPDSYYEALLNTLMPLGACKLYFARTDSDYVASSICIDWNGTRYYVYAATNDYLNRKVHAGPALLWWSVEDAKKHGLRAFDYGGVVPLDWEDHPWIGHTKFKARFGGEIVKGAGTWDMPISKGKYKLYGIAKKLGKG
ncbi:peptidoglycan bridge formation glycyltransferase FemA/FemB family protein [Candidatus Saccharibacteria bacterium]|nr:peptidoglycan bridge formation glycyltransferase FemA/FemB family protein [Candidatus Saccharibacteria bacterium]